jgi:hypothetical protein
MRIESKEEIKAKDKPLNLMMNFYTKSEIFSTVRGQFNTFGGPIGGLTLQN